VKPGWKLKVAPVNQAIRSVLVGCALLAVNGRLQMGHEAEFEDWLRLGLEKAIAPTVTHPCWNCDGTGRSQVFNAGSDETTKPFKDGPCVVCSGRGRLAAND